MNASERSRIVRRLILTRLVPLGMALAIFAGGLWFLSSRQGSEPGLNSEDQNLRVLSYSSFIESWGPGPEIARRFLSETGITVEYINGGDAGVLLTKLDLMPADVVIGVDGLALPAARKARKWRTFNSEIPSSSGQPSEAQGDRSPLDQVDFLAIDWGQLTFIYRSDEIAPPSSLDDLLHPRFRGAIALQDPRTSSPGFQFLIWVLDEKGIEEGFDFLEKLKPNIHSVSGSWSSAYGVFTRGEAKLAFSYVTSPVYHWLHENDRRFAPAVFDAGHPIQVEYVGVPVSCSRCEIGERFARFLRTPEIQRIIMEKNFMFPVSPTVINGTEFAMLPKIQSRQPNAISEILHRQKELLERWRDIGL
jgi:thiamine transport system substrate-binding protein